MRNEETSKGAPAAAEWTRVICPQRSPWDLRLSELWRYRDLIALFVRRDFVAQYKQTVLGPAWHVLQPLLTTIVFTVVFGRIAQMSTDGIPQFPFYMAGTVVWSYFASSFTRTSGTFVSNAHLFGKVYFPRLTVPASVLISGLIGLSVQLAFFWIVAAIYLSQGSIHITAWAVVLPILVIVVGALALGLGLIVASLTTRYRDLLQLVAFGTQLLMYTTTVAYPLSSVPAGLKPWVWLNPMTPIIEAFRYGYLGEGSVDAWHLAYAAGVAGLLVWAGLGLFSRVEGTFADTL